MCYVTRDQCRWSVEGRVRRKNWTFQEIVNRCWESLKILFSRNNLFALRNIHCVWQYHCQEIYVLGVTYHFHGSLYKTSFCTYNQCTMGARSLQASKRPMSIVHADLENSDVIKQDVNLSIRLTLDSDLSGRVFDLLLSGAKAQIRMFFDRSVLVFLAKLLREESIHRALQLLAIFFGCWTLLMLPGYEVSCRISNNSLKLEVLYMYFLWYIVAILSIKNIAHLVV